MIFGSLNVDKDAVYTHRDTYLLENVSVISVRRPFLPMGIVMTIGVGGFGFGFADLLWSHEKLLIAGFCCLGLAIGWFIGQLQLLSRDLRGSELMGAVYGSYRELNQKRSEIASAKRANVLAVSNSG